MRIQSWCKLWASLLVVGFVGSCVIDDRKPDVSLQDASLTIRPAPGAEAGALSAVRRAPGLACLVDTDCASGLCVDGVCCTSACDQLCMACNTPDNLGTCAVVSRDEACGGSCPESTDCVTYGSLDAVANCEGVGSCRTQGNCQETFVAAGLPCEAGLGTCNGQGACAVPDKKLLGEACASSEECAEGHCVAGADGASICCSTACDGPCQACSAGGQCRDVPAHDERCSAVDCPEDNLCRDYADDITTDLCRAFGECRTVRDCQSTELRPAAECACTEAGLCTVINGVACSTATDCRSASCQANLDGDLLCCIEDCTALGMSCSRDGSRCVQCEGESSACDGAISNACVDGLLVATPCGNGCDAASGQCGALRVLGAACAAAAECESGSCGPDIAGTSRCCDPSCADSGRVCGAEGTCVCPPGQLDVDGTCLGAGAQPCTGADTCASGACVATLAGASICCATACPEGSFCSPDGDGCVQCEGTGSRCEGSVSQRCVNGTLSPQDCGNGCNPTSGLCNGLLVPGSVCESSTQCGSGLCAPDVLGDSRCCTPGCEMTGRSCGTDGSCVCPEGREFVRGACRLPPGQSCTLDTDCSSNACEPTEFAGTVCCSIACPGLQCAGSGQGCVQCEGIGSECQGNSIALCQNNFLQLTPCGNGCSVSGGEASCNPLLTRGEPCQLSPQCSFGLECTSDRDGDRRCCDPDCETTGRSCGDNGTCQCPDGQVFDGSVCGLEEGAECDPRDIPGLPQCTDNLPCTTFFLDRDGDGFGSEPRSVCGNDPPPPEGGFAFDLRGGDCCDIEGIVSDGTISTPADVNPEVTAFSSLPAAACPEPFDFNCDGEVVTQFGPNPTLVTGGCTLDADGQGCSGGGLVRVDPTCPGFFSVAACGFAPPPGPGCVGTGNGGPLSCL